MYFRNRICATDKGLFTNYVSGRRGVLQNADNGWQRGERGLGKCWQWLTKGGGRVWTPPFLADIICEQPPIRSPIHYCSLCILIRQDLLSFSYKWRHWATQSFIHLIKPLKEKENANHLPLHGVTVHPNLVTFKWIEIQHSSSGGDSHDLKIQCQAEEIKDL